MHPTTHILSGWCCAELLGDLGRREKAAITLAAVASDVDGFGLLAELLTRDWHRPLLWWTEYHHVLGHNLLFATAVAVAAFLVSRASRVKTGLMAFGAVHLHIFGDLVGSRGPDGYQWPIPYLYPYSSVPWTWSGQWYLNAWPNFVVTAGLLAVTVLLAWRRGESLVGLVSQRADRAFIDVLRRWFGCPIPSPPRPPVR